MIINFSYVYSLLNYTASVSHLVLKIHLVFHLYQCCNTMNSMCEVETLACIEYQLRKD